MTRRPSGSAAVLAVALATVSCLPGCLFSDDCECDEDPPANETRFQRELRHGRRVECERFERDLKYAEEQAKRERRREDD